MLSYRRKVTYRRSYVRLKDTLAFLLLKIGLFFITLAVWGRCHANQDTFGVSQTLHGGAV